MTIKEFLDSFGKDELLALNPSRLAGMSNNEDEAWQELQGLAGKIPALRQLVFCACIAGEQQDIHTMVALRTAINMIVLMYKKDSQEHIDKLLASAKQD